MICHKIIGKRFIHSLFHSFIQCFGTQNAFFPIKSLEMEPLALREIAQARMDFMLMKSCFMKIYKTVWIRNLLTDTPSSNMHPKGIVPKSIEINYDLWFVPCQKSRY